MTDVIVLVGAGSIGQAIARRVSTGKTLVLADVRQENAGAAAKTLSDAGFDVIATTVDVSKRASVEALARQATSLGNVTGMIHAAGVSRPDGAFITGSDFLMDGGVTATFWYGDLSSTDPLQLKEQAHADA